MAQAHSRRDRLAPPTLPTATRGVTAWPARAAGVDAAAMTCCFSFRGLTASGPARYCRTCRDGHCPPGCWSGGGEASRATWASIRKDVNSS